MDNNVIHLNSLNSRKTKKQGVRLRMSQGYKQQSADSTQQLLNFQLSEETIQKIAKIDPMMAYRNQMIKKSQNIPSRSSTVRDQHFERLQKHFEFIKKQSTEK